jgi:hypothetical protein
LRGLFHYPKGDRLRAHDSPLRPGNWSKLSDTPICFFTRAGAIVLREALLFALLQVKVIQPIKPVADGLLTAPKQFPNGGRMLAR